MAYVHVAHDCHIGSDTIFGPHATLGGHVGVEDFANVSAGSGVHQFCRVGRHAFIGGYSVVTKDALPFGKTVGSRPARIFGVNTIGLVAPRLHAGHDPQLKRAYRYLLSVEAEHHARAARDRAGPGADVAGGAVPGRVHPQRASAASSCGGRRGAPRSSSPTE